MRKLTAPLLLLLLGVALSQSVNSAHAQDKSPTAHSEGTTIPEDAADRSADSPGAGTEIPFGEFVVVFAAVTFATFFYYLVVGLWSGGKRTGTPPLREIDGPPENFSPAALAYIYGSTVNPISFLAALLDIEGKGHIAMGTKSGVGSIRKAKPETLSHLPPDEQAIYDSLFADGSDEVWLVPQNRATFLSMRRKFYDTLKSEYKSKYVVRNIRTGCPGCLGSLFLVSLGFRLIAERYPNGDVPLWSWVPLVVVLAMMYFRFSARDKTERGSELAGRIGGFKNYLEERLRSLPEINSSDRDIDEAIRLLPYAVAFDLKTPAWDAIEKILERAHLTEAQRGMLYSYACIDTLERRVWKGRY